jgi:trehalose 6-phosphate synthase
MSRLVVVSNRVGDVSKGAQAGGLAVAVGDSLRRTGGLWFGWNGEIDESLAERADCRQVTGNVSLATLPLSQRDYDEYYLGYSNRVLWPAFHYRLDLAEFEADFIDGYRRVNARMARVLAGLLEPDDVIWIHDYHMFPLAAELRGMGVRQRIGFFLHIPFPSKEIIIAVPQHEWLIRSLFSYDLIGFQSQRDLSNFRRYVVDEAGGTVGEGSEVTAYGRTLSADAFPIGIDADSIWRMAHTKEAVTQIKRLRRRILDRKHMIGVDRLDYSKGLVRRFYAFEKLLHSHPSLRRTVTFTQFAPASREDVEAYADIRDELLSLSGVINGEFGEFDWTPLRCITRPATRRTLAALFRGSEVGVVTPLRDGMNLVAKEYVAAQDEEDPGVLILSRFAGAAEQLREALIVNPYDIDEVVEAMRRALTMSRQERRERHLSLLQCVREHDVHGWSERFLSTLKRTPADAPA